jgi:rubrerythrin
MMSFGTVDALAAARRAEKEQALFYRAHAARAEDRGDSDDAEALSGLHADEQHHLSRLSVRLVELGATLDSLDDLRIRVEDTDWRTAARTRERAEVALYEELLRLELDDETRRLIEDILDVERAHERTLGGKHMKA